MGKSGSSGEADVSSKHRLLEQFKRAYQYIRLRLVRQPATPHQIGLGFALGVLAAHLPVLPLQIVLALILAWLLKANKVSAVLGTYLTNPLTTIPFHLFFYHIGKALVPFEVPQISQDMLEVEVIIKAGWELYATMCVGALILAVPLSILFYFLAKWSAEAYQKRRERRSNINN